MLCSVADVIPLLFPYPGARPGRSLPHWSSTSLQNALPPPIRKIRKFLDPSLDGDSKIVFSLEYHNVLRLASITLAIKYDISKKAKLCTYINVFSAVAEYVHQYTK